MQKTITAKICLVALLLYAILLTSGCTDDKEEKICGLTERFYLPGSDTDKNDPYRVSEPEDKVFTSSDVAFEFDGRLPDDLKAHEQLLRKYNDTHYKNPFPNELSDPIGAWVLGEDLMDIEITCAQNFDAKHPAGSEMGDITYFEWTSFYKLIQHGYSFSGLDGNGPYISSFQPHKAVYHALTGDKSIYPIRMICILSYGDSPKTHLYFGTQPDVPGIYTFNVKFKFETCNTEHQFKVKF